MIRAILRAQLLSMRIGANRGAAFTLVAGTIWYGLWSLLACAAFAFARVANGEELRYWLPLAFLAVLVYWQVIPVLSATMGSGLDMRKLLVYPVPHGRLFLVEVLLRLTAGLEMLLILAGGTAGLAGNPEVGGWASMPRLLLAVLLFAAFNVLAASGMRSLLERLLSRRRVREVLALLMVLAWVTPRLLVVADVRPTWLNRAGAAVGAAGSPWSAAAHLGFPGPAEPVWTAFLALCGWILAAGWFGRRQFERSLRFDAVAAQATRLNSSVGRRPGFMERFYRFPGLVWRDPLAAIIEKELRSLARSPRFRTVFIMGFTFGLMVWLPVTLNRGQRPTELMSRYFLTVVCVYALTLMGQVTYWNCFGFDRAAAQIYFLAPQRLATTLVGKNIAYLVFIYVEVLIITTITALLGMTQGWSHVFETFVVVGICSLYMLALGNVSSVQYPRAMNPERVSQGGSSGRFHALVFLLYPLALIPVFLAYLARYAFASDTAFVVVLAIAAAVGGVLYWVAMDSAVTAAGRRRERLIQELTRGEGPVATT